MPAVPAPGNQPRSNFCTACRDTPNSSAIAAGPIRVPDVAYHLAPGPVDAGQLVERGQPPRFEFGEA